jgi:hypothetical protein
VCVRARAREREGMVQIDIETRGIRMLWVDGALAGWVIGRLGVCGQTLQTKGGSQRTEAASAGAEDDVN